jgi:hypothetical protein
MCSFAAVLFSIISLYSSRPTDYSSCLPHALLLFEKLSACLTKSRYCFFRLACDIGERLGRKLEDTLSTRVQTKSPQPMEMKQLNISATLPFLGFQTFLISSQASNEGSLAPSPPLWCFCELVGHHLFDFSTDYPNSCFIYPYTRKRVDIRKDIFDWPSTTDCNKAQGQRRHIACDKLNHNSMTRRA